jgi:hypothetical protein
MNITQMQVLRYHSKHLLTSTVTHLPNVAPTLNMILMQLIFENHQAIKAQKQTIVKLI